MGLAADCALDEGGLFLTALMADRVYAGRRALECALISPDLRRLQSVAGETPAIEDTPFEVVLFDSRAAFIAAIFTFIFFAPLELFLNLDSAISPRSVLLFA